MVIIKLIFALAVMGISAYGLIAEDFSNGPISTLIFGIFFAIIGIEEYKKKGKNSWVMFFMPVSLLIIVLALFSF